MKHPRVFGSEVDPDQIRIDMIKRLEKKQVERELENRAELPVENKAETSIGHKLDRLERTIEDLKERSAENDVEIREHLDRIHQAITHSKAASDVDQA